MNQRKVLIVVGIVVFLIFVVTTIPARMIATFVPTDIARISDTSGTIWNGQARSVVVAEFRLSNVRWNLHALSLLIGRLAMTVEGEWGTGFVRGDVGVGVTGAVRVRDLRLAGPLAPVLRQLNMQGNGGELSVEIAELDVADNWPTRVVGTVGVGRLPFSMLGIGGGSTGNYVLEFDLDAVGDDGVLPGMLSDAGGPLELLGELRITPPQNYSIQARLKARPDAPPELSQGLLLTGPKLPDGSHEFQMSGSL